MECCFQFSRTKESIASQEEIGKKLKEVLDLENDSSELLSLLYPFFHFSALERKTWEQAR
jgi:hypothetical protein